MLLKMAILVLSDFLIMQQKSNPILNGVFMNRYFFHTKFVLITILALQTAQLAGYHAAGVVPYAKKENNEIILLLGCEAIKGGQICDFGGGKDWDDGENPAITAAREGSEELMFMLDEDADFPHLLQKKLANAFDCNKTKTYNHMLSTITKNGTGYSSEYNGYVTHFVEIPYNKNLPKKFVQRKGKYESKLPFCWNEKITMSWVPLQDIMNAVSKSKDCYSVYINTACGNTQLFPLFVESLKAAQKNKLSFFA